MPPTSYYHQSRDRSVYSKNFKQLLDHSIVVVVVVVFLSNAMFSNYVLSFAQTTGVAVDIALSISPVLYVKLLPACRRLLIILLHAEVVIVS